MNKLLALLVVAALALHNDFWWWTDKTLILGFIPIGLFSQIVYTFIAVGLMAILVKHAWPHELEHEFDAPARPMEGEPAE